MAPGTGWARRKFTARTGNCAANFCSRSALDGKYQTTANATAAIIAKLRTYLSFSRRYLSSQRASMMAAIGAKKGAKMITNRAWIVVMTIAPTANTLFGSRNVKWYTI